ncbi:UDP-glucose:sterol glucosyltransferase 80A2 [Hyphodiscus hymeniophilus]|uniref:UDP-glucose:sterol glucosyltransferase 80A2 n=1 Tax=Hyphodiscus hymeniophilus TaxID=353542 RepID=A0A9P6VPV2_9HELO|nr:UDP-glucose:sterol glucosyltransferase 80A2 [Hyphodiscus hymeniophilus]
MAADSGSSLSNGAPAAPRRALSETITQPASTAQKLKHISRPGLGIASQRQTERPKPTAKNSILHTGLRRHATNPSAAQHAVFSHSVGDEDSTSSSSDSSDSESEKKPRAKHSRPQRRGNHNSYRKFDVGNEEYSSKGRVSKKDGRLNISVSETNNRGYLAKALGFMKHVGPGPSDQMSPSRHDEDGEDYLSSASNVTSAVPRPKLNIVVMVIGSRGDIQPFLKLGKALKGHGHRVRIATHPAFRDFVQKDSGLDFFSVGGDPAELMAFMVKNPGMIPTMETLKKGEVGRRREQMAEMFEGFWRACINATDDEKDVSNLRMMGDKAPFIADAIIANPPSFAHIHCAERLGIPLHLMFTFPYTPTQAFPHPLANIKKTNVDPGYANFMSYPLVEMMTWQGLGDLVNNFRVKTLGLEPVSKLWAPGQLYRLKVPYTYLWSLWLVPKPEDWGPEIDIAGFVFLDLASSFKPPQELTDFLDAGDPPVYIGFGSIVVDDPDKFTKMIFEAVKKAGVRALVSKGWGGLGDEDNTPDSVYMLENTPHDWLFPKCSAVVHHGGAGTTAIGLKCGKPTMIVPFFGDQQFWGSMIGEAGAGAKPVPYKELTSDKLAEGIKQCLTDEAREASEKIAHDIEEEGDGSENAVTSFHRSLTLRGLNSMRCSILEDRVAVWSLRNTSLRLSALAAELLVERKKVTWKQLRLIRHNEWNDFEGPGEPISGVTTALMGTMAGVGAGVGSIPFKIAKSAKKRSRLEKMKRKKSMQVNDKRRGDRLMTSSKTKGKSSNGAQMNGQTDSITMKANDDEADEQTKKKESESNDPPQREVAGSIPASKAPGKGLDDKATTGPDMGKHTVSGEPIIPERVFEKEKTEHHDDDGEDDDSSLSDESLNNAAEDIGKDVGSGLGHTAEAFARMPMDLSLALAQGFHNAPRLYGDATVRRPARITGMKSGLKAAGQEFVLGIYDGVTGVVVQPYTGARDNGALGFVKGIGMGLTGFVLKDIAAIFGPFGYTLKGVHKELLKSKQPTKFIRRARIMQGQRDLEALDEEEERKVKEAVYHGWAVVQQVHAIMEETRAQGLKGKVKVLRERKEWRANGAFENVEMAEKAVAAKKQGESLESVFAQQRKELELLKVPRKKVTDEMEQREKPVGAIGHDDKQVTQACGSANSEAQEKPAIVGR